MARFWALTSSLLASAGLTSFVFGLLIASPALVADQYVSMGCPDPSYCKGASDGTSCTDWGCSLYNYCSCGWVRYTEPDRNYEVCECNS